MKEIPLTRGYVALVDDEDFERVNAFKWCADVRKGPNATIVYAQRHGPRAKGVPPKIYMHHVVLGSNKRTDHRDGNGLNNQRHNLRSATQSQNLGNRRKGGGVSRFKGVSWAKNEQKWKSEIQTQGVRYGLGYFKDEVDAAQAYNFKALELYGEFARFNTLDSGRATISGRTTQ